MEPRLISMIVQPQDIIAELIKRRVAELQSKNPQFRAQFFTLENKIKDQRQMLKQEKQDMSEQLFGRVMQELQVREYKLRKEALPFRRQFRSRHQRGLNRQYRESGYKQSNRNSQISQTSFQPYKLSNFTRELHNLKIKSQLQ